MSQEPPVLVARGLRVQHDGRAVVGAVDVDVRSGEIRALVGASGAGKSTVLRALVALQPFAAGEIRVAGVVLHAGPVPPERRLHELRRSIGLVFQSSALFAHLTALENVTLAPMHALGASRNDAETKAMRLLDELGVAARAHARPHQLSGGEAQRVAIARALATDPRVLLMDEPTAALDPARRASLGQSLRQLAREREGRGILVATHDVDFARSFADRVSVLAGGVIVEEGPADQVLGAPRHRATRDLLLHRDE